MIPIFIGIIIFTVIILSYKYDNIQNKKKKIVRIYLFAIAIFSVIWASSYLYRNFQEPHEWDFLCWYLDGSVAANGLNFYQPTSYQTTINSLVLPYAPSKAFISNIVDVGFKYPPPSMFYLITLGYLSYNRDIFYGYQLILFVLFSAYIFYGKCFCLKKIWLQYL